MIYSPLTSPILQPTNFYVVDLGESKEVEALPNVIGLKVAIVYSANTDTHEVVYQMWKCANRSKLQVTYMNGPDIYTTGDNTSLLQTGKVVLPESAFDRVVAALQYTAPVTRSVRF